MEKLKKMEEGEYLVYADAGSHLESPIHPLLMLMEAQDEKLQGFLALAVGFLQRRFCKRHAFIRSKCDTNQCHDAMQVDGFLIALRKGPHAMRVVEAWLELCQDYEALNDDKKIGDPDNFPNLKEFREHRHDQALLTNLMTRENWGRDTTNGPGNYMFKHDRRKD